MSFIRNTDRIKIVHVEWNIGQAKDGRQIQQAVLSLVTS